MRKLHSKLPIFRKLHSKLPIFRVKSVKIYTGQFFSACDACDKYEVMRNGQSLMAMALKLKRVTMLDILHNSKVVVDKKN